jgi:hypothetical protein
MSETMQPQSSSCRPRGRKFWMLSYGYLLTFFLLCAWIAYVTMTETPQDMQRFAALAPPFFLLAVLTAIPIVAAAFGRQNWRFPINPVANVVFGLILLVPCLVSIFGLLVVGFLFLEVF